MRDIVSFFINLPRINKIVFWIGLIGIGVSIIGIRLSDDESLIQFYDNLHWTFGTVAAAVLTGLHYKRNRFSSLSKTSLWFFLGFAGYALGQIIWDIQTALSFNLFPSPSDFFYLLLGPCMTIALFYEVRSQRDKLNQSVFWLDLLALSVAALTLILVSYLPRGKGIDFFAMSILVSYPITLLIPVFMVILMIPSGRLHLNSRISIFLMGISVTALSWMHWNSLALDGMTSNGAWFNISFSLAILVTGLVASEWKLTVSNNPEFDRLSEAFLRFLPMITVIISSLAIVLVSTNPLLNVLIEQLIYIGAAMVIVLAIIRQSRLLHERDQLLEVQSEALKSATLIKTIIQHAPLRIFWKDRELNYLGCNDLFARDAGFESFEQIVGKSDFEMGWKDQANLYRADDWHVMESKNSVLGYEEPQTTPDGSQIWLRTSKVPLIDPSTGATIGILGIYDDITEHKKIQIALEESENFLKQSQINAGIGSYSLDINSMFWKSSETLDEIFGIDGDEEHSLEGWINLIHPDDREGLNSYFQENVLKDHQKFDREYRIIRANDQVVRWVHGLGRLELNDSNEPIKMFGTIQDITERKEYENLAKEQQKEFETIFNMSKDGIAVLDRESNFLDFNEAYLKMTGFSREELLSTSCIALSAPEDKEHAGEAMQTILKTGFLVGFEKTCIVKDGKRIVINLTATVLPDNKRILITTKNITENKKHEEQLEYMAHYDLLTGLPNRILKADRLRHAMIQCQRRNENIAVLYLDLDGFKEVNDRYGHDIGDKLLVALSSKMQLALREGDTLARLGGDEFVAILVDLDDISIALSIIQRLLDVSNQAIEIDDILLQISASIGVVFYPQTEEVDADQLIRQADQAMYIAKQSGKNRYHIFDSEHDRQIRTKHENIERIRQALDHHELILYFQPKINMQTGMLIGAEALIRWEHPEQGLIPPLEFLPIIENHLLAIEVGEWVINEAIVQIKHWQKQGIIIPLSVNVGAKQLLQGDFVQRLQWILAQHNDFDPSLLEIEVLETSALENVNQASQIIKECEILGIHFALDDFGTGYSSLTYLKQLPVKTLKIDQSFVRDMLEDSDDLAILEGVIGLAKAFDRAVIAEGVETHEHGKQLLLLGCDLAQGYGIARPMPSEIMIEWVKKWEQNHQWIV